MSIILGDEVVRNIPEQVADNTEDIAALKSLYEREKDRYKEHHFIYLPEVDYDTLVSISVYGLYKDELLSLLSLNQSGEELDVYRTMLNILHKSPVKRITIRSNYWRMDTEPIVSEGNNELYLYLENLGEEHGLGFNQGSYYPFKIDSY